MILIDTIELQNILTNIGIILAYLAYTKSIQDKYDSWKALLQSFLDELNTMHAWIGGEYKENDYDKNFFNPNKQVFKLTTITAEEIVRKGINDIKIISDKYRDKLALFIERITAFNSAIDNVSRIASSDPVLSQKLRNKLIDFGLFDPDITITQFEYKIEHGVKFKTLDEYLLMKQIFSANKAIHQSLINEIKNEDRLSYLYKYLKEKTDKVIDRLSKKELLPWYVKHKGLALLGSVIFYLVLEYFLK